MEKRLNRLGLGLGAGFIGMLMLFGTDNTIAISSFKNTPLYKHIIKRRNAESVRLYEAEPINSGKQEEVAGKSGDEKTKISEKNEYVKEIKGGGTIEPLNSAGGKATGMTWSLPRAMRTSTACRGRRGAS